MKIPTLLRKLQRLEPLPKDLESSCGSFLKDTLKEYSLYANFGWPTEVTNGQENPCSRGH